MKQELKKYAQELEKSIIKYEKKRYKKLKEIKKKDILNYT